jgi:hypothetical protein
LFSLHTLALDLKAKHVQCELVESSFKKIYYSFFVLFLFLFILYSFQTTSFKPLIPLPPFWLSAIFLYKGKPILGWYHKEPPRKMVEESKTAKSFSWALFVKCFHNYKILFFHVYQFHALIYGLITICIHTSTQHYESEN